MVYRRFFSSPLLALFLLPSAVCPNRSSGNGVVDANEQCDDSNDIDGDGCEANCALTAANAFSATTPRSSAIALSDDQKTLIMVNHDDGTVSIFDTEQLTRRANLTLIQGD